MSEYLENYIREMAYENKSEQLSDLKDALELMVEMPVVERKYFHPKELPRNLDEAFEIYRQHGPEDWTVEAQEIYQLKAVSDLLHGKRFIAVDYSGFYDGDAYFIFEFSDDFDEASRLRGVYDTLDEAIEAEARMGV